MKCVRLRFAKGNSSLQITGKPSCGDQRDETHASLVIEQMHECAESYFMKRDQWKIKVGGALLAISLVFGIAVLSVRAQAQNPDDRYSQDRNADQNRRGRDWDRYGNYGGSSE